MIHLPYSVLVTMELPDLENMSTFTMQLMEEDIKHSTYLALVDLHELLSIVIDELETFAHNEEN